MNEQITELETTIGEQQIVLGELVHELRQPPRQDLAEKARCLRAIGEGKVPK